MFCPQCGALNAEGRRFCLECGAALEAACGACGAANEPAARFCGACGARIAGGAAPGRPAGTDASAPPTGPGLLSQPAPVAERRVVSVLFADLVGFTSLAEERDPEAVRELQGRYFEAARDTVARYGGLIEKFIGDAVMAVWGTPTAHEDDAERAVRAALELVDAVPALGRSAGVELRLRAGVLTGEAAVTIGATGQGMVAGDLVNTASRLQAVAPAGTVLVGAQTRQAAGPAIAFEAAGDQLLKGKTAPVPAYRALRVVAERGGAGRPDALEPPFVGRADELRLLKEQFHATGRERRARLVSLVGQAGIGKSRLAWELEKYLDGVVETVWWHRGRSPAYGEGVTFWALGEMIRRRAGLAEGDDEGTTRRGIAEMLTRHVPDAHEQRWIEPRLLTLLGVEDAPPGGREELFAAWRTLFERIGADGTVALVIEDLQWSDDGLLDFLEHLLDWSRGHPVFVLTLTRPELFERRPGWGADRRGAVSLRLEPLAEAPMRELLAGLVPGLPEAMAGRILERADGIPLYAVETVRMLLNDGRLVAEDGIFRPAGDLGDLEVPPTLHALVAARLDGLDAPDRALLQDASVLGQSFTLPALAAVSGDDPARLAARLVGLVRRDLLAIETDPRAPTRGQHAFVQALIREVAYGTLARRERRARHLAAARYYEALEDDELAGALATHFVAAYRAAPEGPEGEAAAAQARVALQAAAARAEALGALGQAVEWLVASLDVTTEAAERATLLQRIGWTQALASRGSDAARTLADAVEAWRALGDRAGAIHATALLALADLSGGQIARAVETLEPVRADAEALASDAAAGLAVAWYAEAYARASFRAERNEDAISWADRAVALAEPRRLDEIVAMALVTKGTALVNLGRRREGIALLNGALLDARAHGLNVAALRAGVNLAAMTMDVDPRAALERTREGMAVARRLGLRGFDPYHAGNACDAAESVGEWAWTEQALGELERENPDPGIAEWIADCGAYSHPWQGHDVKERMLGRLTQVEAAGDPQSVIICRDTLVRAAFAREDFRAAVVWGTPILEYTFTTPRSRSWVGRAALHAGDLAVARRVAAMLEPSPGGASDGDLGALRGGIAAIEGRRDEALASYRGALAVYRETGLRFLAAMVGLDMSALLGPEVPGVRAAAAEAREILVDLGAAPLIARLDRLMATGSQVSA